MAIYQGIKNLSSRSTQLNVARELLLELETVKVDAIATAGLLNLDIPLYLGIVQGKDGYPVPAAAFYSQGSPRIVVDIYNTVGRTKETLSNDVWHEVGHAIVYASDPERYRQISQTQIPLCLHDTALNVFELFPRLFAAARTVPKILLDIVLGDTFAKSVQVISQVPALAASVLSHHPDLLLKVPLNLISNDLQWNGTYLSEESTELLATRVEETLQILRESQTFSKAMSLL